MSLGKRRHEIWTKGGSARVNKRHHRRRQIEQKKQHNKNCKHQKLLIATLLVRNKANRDSSRTGLSEGTGVQQWHRLRLDIIHPTCPLNEALLFKWYRNTQRSETAPNSVLGCNKEVPDTNLMGLPSVLIIWVNCTARLRTSSLSYTVLPRCHLIKGSSWASIALLWQFVALPALCLARYLSLYCFFFFPNQVQLACCSCLVFSIAIQATRLQRSHTHEFKTYVWLYIIIIDTRTGIGVAGFSNW